MIPILYSKNETVFTSQGVGPLSDALSCNVTEERNGAYELVMTYATSGVHYDDIEINSIIKAIPADNKAPQLFRVYEISKPLNRVVTINAEHISYQLNHIPVSPFNAQGVVNTLNGLVSNSAETNPFSVWTDLDNSYSNYSQLVPNSFRSQLGGVSGSVLDVFGGEYEWNNYTVKLWAHRGANNGVQILYGKNLVDLTQEESIADTVTGVYPYWQSEGVVVTLTEKIIESQYADVYPFRRTIVKDFSADFTEQPSEDQLRSATISYISNNSVGVPKVNLNVSFLALSDTEEYKNLSAERINLCDTVTVVFSELGVSATAKVIKTDYNVLSEMYNSIEVGDAKASLVKDLSDTETKLSETATLSQVADSLSYQVELMNGGLGGNVVIKYVNNYPSEVYIGDTQDVNTMTNLIRVNKNGIAFSQNGIGGTYTSAWTIDGTFNANFIGAGEMDGVYIKAGTITTDTLTVGLNSLIQEGVTANELVNNLGVYFRYDANGCYIGKVGDDISTTITNNGMVISNQNVPQLTISKDGVDGINGTFHKYLTVGDHATQLTARMEHYEDDIDNDQIATFLIPRG